VNTTKAIDVVGNYANAEVHDRPSALEERIRAQQQRLLSDLKLHYDFIVCGSESSGSVAVGANVCSCTARLEVVLSLGAINTPRVLMQSGIGDEAELGRLGIPVVHHLPGVGCNFQDHFLIARCLWEYPEPCAPRNNATEAVTFWKSDPSLDTPDMQLVLIELPYVSAALATYNPPAHAWGLCPGIVRPKSRGHLRLMGVNPLDPITIVANTVSAPDDLKAAVRAVDLGRTIGNAVPLRPLVQRAVMPTGLQGAARETFVRDGALSYWHQSCTAKMGRDAMSVVDNSLAVYGIAGLRIADAAIMPRVTTGNTIAPCVVIGERAARILRTEHKL
jgi:choline dehydrogenase